MEIINHINQIPINTKKCYRQNSNRFQVSQIYFIPILIIKRRDLLLLFVYIQILPSLSVFFPV